MARRVQCRYTTGERVLGELRVYECTYWSVSSLTLAGRLRGFATFVSPSDVGLVTVVVSLSFGAVSRFTGDPRP